MVQPGNINKEGGIAWRILGELTSTLSPTRNPRSYEQVLNVGPASLSAQRVLAQVKAQTHVTEEAPTTAGPSPLHHQLRSLQLAMIPEL